MKPNICITMGDPAGIGAEITVKALGNSSIYDRCRPIVVGDTQALEEAVSFTGSSLKLHKITRPGEAASAFGIIDYIDLGLLAPRSWEYKQVNPLCGKAAYKYIEKGIGLALAGSVDAVVTGPISKESLHLAGYHFSGHTEIFAELTGTKDYAMFLCSETLRVIHVTTHVSMREACDRITTERVYTVIRLADETMRLLGVERPRIGVAGFNAHSSENGLFGDQEEKAIIPAISEAAKQGFCVDGPVPPDTVFVKAMAGQYDIVVAMYHDQGHIPVKLSGFKLDTATNRYTSVSGVNCTVGLPIIRSSVDHGTAFDRAGEGRANEESMVDAILMALRMSENRKSAK